MKNSKGFTFIELLMVVLIISIIGVFSISSFWNFFKNQDNSAFIWKIKDTIETLDFKVKKWQMTSYRLWFESGAQGLAISKNFYKKDNILTLASFDFENMSWSISWWTWEWLLKSYYNSKFENWYYGSWASNLSFSLTNPYMVENIELYSSIDGKDVNSFEIMLFNKDDSNIDKNIKVSYLSWWVFFNKIEIKNVLWKKQIYWYPEIGDSLELDDFELWFERWWNDFNLALSK